MSVLLCEHDRSVKCTGRRKGGREGGREALTMLLGCLAILLYVCWSLDGTSHSCSISETLSQSQKLRKSHITIPATYALFVVCVGVTVDASQVVLLMQMEFSL